MIVLMVMLEGKHAVVLAVTELETTSSFRAIVIISIFTTPKEQRDSLSVFVCEMHCVNNCYYSGYYKDFWDDERNYKLQHLKFFEMWSSLWYTFGNTFDIILE